MKVLVATKESQGELPGDYSWTVEGELVTAVVCECSSPKKCGCGRGFPGLASATSHDHGDGRRPPRARP